MNYREWNQRVDIGQHATWLDEIPPTVKPGERIKCPVCGLLHDANALQAYQWVFNLDEGQAYCKVISPPCHPENTTVMPIVNAVGWVLGVYNGFTVDYYAPHGVVL